MKPLKIRTREWINSLYEKYPFNENEKVLKDYPFYFKLEGFADEPEVYLRTTVDSLEFGYEATQWDGYMPSPVPGIYKKHSLSWETLQSLNKEQQQEIIHELLMKTINSRKRQYRKCQFCGGKVAVEHRFDKDTCHGCASEHFHVVY
ncbi:hypothetical protein P8864_05205 [Priestia flexa]|uniref:hypothetical protein n=1 Tax=Priestia flexa TaxID=86664 RepID=UPI000C246A93|nr:hypothetical protein [Priestia flexa]MEC0665337.1 hypothetical protein [Priestia flexa]MED3824672.1 hypothetical protein [Priestia flexa]